MEHDSFEAILAYIYVGQVDVSMEGGASSNSEA